MVFSKRFTELSALFMMILATSAAFVGLVHSLNPGHWLPVVLTAKAQKWSLKTAVLGAITAAAGHIVLSAALSLISIAVGAQLLSSYEPQIERYSALGVMVFGLIYALVSYFSHLKCTHHAHHPSSGTGPRKAPFFFLFSVGLSPCVAVLPILAEAALGGVGGVFVAILAFALGVLAALIGSTVLVFLGFLKLDHPILEHYADVVTGLGVAAVGLGIFLFS